MADLRYSVEVDTRGAESSLRGLASTVAGISASIVAALSFQSLIQTSRTFEDLRTSLQLLYKDAAIGNRVFADIKDFAASSIFSVNDLTETIIKLKAAGLDPTIAQLRLFADVSSVAADSVGALQAITDLYARTTAGGLGLEDLNRLADRGIPVFTILSERLGLSRLEISKIGQTAEGAQLILKALEEGLNDTFGGASAARANNLSQAMSNFGDTVSGISDLIGRTGLNEALVQLIRSFGELLEESKPLLVALGIALSDAIKFLADNIKIVTAVAAGFLAVLSVSAILRIGQAIGALNAVLGKNPLVKLGIALATAAGALVGFKISGDEAASSMKEFDQVLKDFEKNPAVKGLQEGALATGTSAFKNEISALNTELIRSRESISQIGIDYQRQNSELTKRLQLEKSLIGLSERDKVLKNAIADSEQSYLSTINRLLDEYRVKSQSKNKEDLAVLPDIQRQIALVSQEYERQVGIIKELTVANFDKAESERRNIALSEFSIKTQIDGQNRLRAIQDDIAKTGMNEIQKKYYDIARASQDSARSAIESENARRRSLKLAEMTAQEEEQYYQRAKITNDDLIRSTDELYQKSRQFNTGWRSAFNEYIDDATNAAKVAQDVFRKATQGMEDLIVNFAKTGKFEWKNFVASMAEELLRSQIRQLMANLFTAGPGATTNSGNFLSSILGFANGGIIPTNGPVLVGERGPEIISGASGRVVTPNEQLGGTTVVNYNISAVDAMSFKAMIARDPGFIHAVAQQGARTVPGRF